MGDRGGTATPIADVTEVTHYTRWEIGGEPQQNYQCDHDANDYTRWEIGGEPQPTP